MAIKSQQARLDVSTATIAADTVTAATKANPCVVTCGTHGIANGKIITIDGVVGMIELNGRAFVASNVAATTIELKGVDSTGYTTYVSGGSVVEQTMTEVGGINAMSGFDGEAGEIDTTTLRDTAKTYLIGLQDFGNISLGFFLITDTGQARLRALKGTAATGTFDIILSDGTTSAFRALVKSFSFDTGGPDGAVSGSCTLRITGEPSWFA